MVTIDVHLVAGGPKQVRRAVASMSEITTTLDSEPKPDTFGLPPSLRVPVAARDTIAIDTFVGETIKVEHGRTRPINAIKVRTRYIPERPSDAQLWRQSQATIHLATLFPEHQLWVHVDFSGYRRAWIRLGMPELPPGFVLDHVANRRATRARGMLHPFIRLCPVSGKTNTSAGNRRGGEGMEVEFTKWLNTLSPEERTVRMKNFATAIVYADPMDLTKMLNVVPGTETLDGVRDFQSFFYGQ